MKITNDDFTSHVCDDPSKDGDGLGWNLETDMTTEGKDELIRNQKLQELIEEKIEDFASRKLPHVVIHELHKLLEASKK